MIEVFSNPSMMDFLHVCWNLPEDEKQQMEAMSGLAFDVDGAAVGNYMSPGPKWVIKVDKEPICIGGYIPQRPGVWRDFMLNTKDAFAKHPLACTRTARKVMEAMFTSEQAHRLECVSLASRSRAHKWYRTLGLNREGVLKGYAANGADCIIFARVK